ncbi:MAG: sugar phosphate isomerase/epimerase family protein [Bacteroidota bacterium]
MKLGFVSAILPDQSLEQVFHTAADMDYDCVEIMCWPKGKVERRYAGVTHLDVANLSDQDIETVQQLEQETGVFISGLGYYPNPLASDIQQSQTYIDHIYKLIDAAVATDIRFVNTFIGRDPKKTIDENWARVKAIWQPIMSYAEANEVYVSIENCPMLFTEDEWPGGLNLGTTPAIWDRLFNDIPSDFWGINFDPSHYIIQRMDYVETIEAYHERFHHIHAKDARIDHKALNYHGAFSYPNLWHEPKLPGMGDVDWGKFFSALTSVGYDGPVCVEVEDRAYEGSLDKQHRALLQSYNYLRQWVV